MRGIAGLGLLLGTLSPLGLAAQSSDAQAESDLPAGLTEWLPSQVLPGLSYMPLVGEGGKAGAFVYRIRASDGVRIPPHWHTRTMHLTILSGTLVMVMASHDPVSSKIRTRMPSVNPHRASCLLGGQLGCAFTFSWADACGMSSRIVVCDGVGGT